MGTQTLQNHTSSHPNNSVQSTLLLCSDSKTLLNIMWKNRNISFSKVLMYNILLVLPNISREIQYTKHVEGICRKCEMLRKTLFCKVLMYYTPLILATVSRKMPQQCVVHPHSIDTSPHPSSVWYPQSRNTSPHTC